MNWLEKKIFNWGISAQQKEFDRWYDALSAMSGSELGMLLAVATNTRHVLEQRYGVNLLDPMMLETVDPNFVFTLHGIIKELQRSGDTAEAAGVMVWLFTVRCSSAAEMRSRGRLLWKTLQRGFPHVDDQAAEMAMLGARYPNTDGFDIFPSGLEPEPPA